MALRIRILLLFVFSISSSIDAQITAKKFGDGLRISALDSSFYMRAAFRFQTLYTGEWRQDDEESSYSLEDHSFLI